MAQEPIKKIQLGNIQAAIWKHDKGDQKRPRFTVSINRRYQDKDGIWQNSDYFDHSDLPVVSKAMDFAYGWIWNAQQAEAKKSKRSA